MIREVQQVIIPATLEGLLRFKRSELRDYAKALGVERGRNKINTAKNIHESGRAKLLASLLIE